MCLTTRQTYFASILDGAIQTLADLPLVWQIPKGENFNPPWIDVPAGAETVLYPAPLDYLGLAPIPPPTQYLAVSNGYTTMLFAANGRLWRYNATTGFMEGHDDVKGTDSPFQLANVLSDGKAAVVMFEDNVYIWSFSTPDVWAIQPHPGFQHRDLKLFLQFSFSARFLVTGHDASTNTIAQWQYQPNNSGGFFILPQRSLAVPGPSNVLWVAINSDGSTSYICVDQGDPMFYFVYAFPLVPATPTPTSPAAIIVKPVGPTLTGPWSAICRDDGSTLDILALDRSGTKIMYRAIVNLGPANGSMGVQESEVTALSEPDARNRFAFTRTTVMSVFMGTNLTNVNYALVATSVAFHGNTSGLSDLGFSPNGTSIYALTADREFFFQDNLLNIALPWSTQSFLPLNELAHVSDYGLMDLVPQPDMTWFFGYTIVQEPILPGSNITSPHQFFRLLVAPSPILVPGEAYATITAKLQQANFAALSFTGGTQLQFANDGNLKIKNPVSTNVVWDNRITDAFNSDDTIVTFTGSQLLSGRPFGTLNGLYLCYSDEKNVNIVYNVFNNGAFAAYCQLVGERPGLALSRQGDFCWENLFHASTRTFADTRCTCLTGSKGIDLLFPGGEAESFNDITRARLEHNLPCMLNECQGIVNIPEETNVYLEVVKDCGQKSLTVCSSLIVGDGVLTIQRGQIVQNCASNILNCSDDVKCPIGTVCVGGRCVPTCTQNSQCGFGSECIDGICFRPEPSQDEGSGGDNGFWNAVNITLIVLGIVLFFALLTFLLVYFLVIKKRVKTSTPTVVQSVAPQSNPSYYYPDATPGNYSFVQQQPVLQPYYDTSVSTGYAQPTNYFYGGGSFIT